MHNIFHTRTTLLTIEGVMVLEKIVIMHYKIKCLIINVVLREGEFFALW